jgi:hypothetical protein
MARLKRSLVPRLVGKSAGPMQSLFEQVSGDRNPERFGIWRKLWR